jgi:hypothetical protein
MSTKKWSKADRDRQKYNYQAYRAMGKSPAEARRLRNRTPARTYAEIQQVKPQLREIRKEVKKMGGTVPPIPKIPASLSRKADRQSFSRYLSKTYKFSKAAAGRLSNLSLEKQFNIQINIEKAIKTAMREGALTKGMTRAKVLAQIRKSVKGARTEVAFWRAIKEWYLQQVGVKAELAGNHH